MKKTYLGDGVYVAIEGDSIRLTTENGIEETNIIYLEPEVWGSLVGYVTGLRAVPTDTSGETKEGT